MNEWENRSWNFWYKFFAWTCVAGALFTVFCMLTFDFLGTVYSLMWYLLGILVFTLLSCGLMRKCRKKSAVLLMFMFVTWVASASTDTKFESYRDECENFLSQSDICVKWRERNANNPFKNPIEFEKNPIEFEQMLTKQTKEHRHCKKPRNKETRQPQADNKNDDGISGAGLLLLGATGAAIIDDQM